MISLISSLEIINLALPVRTTFIWTDAFVACAAAVNPNATKPLSASGVSTFPMILWF